ncbi:hypothetical protein FCJ85_05520 [Acinetobacter baumannii]|nr:hypothetical protein F6W76_08775 [Acinetobacter baumannii]KAB1095024.1 hypothetical protein F6W77_17610 [Acinetobacter baumannii]KAB1586196.1 hypothetical protein F8B17_08770 [Acinetobacter baumannii]KAB1594749.1 hypothetical protein F8B15_08920 [Acinetobacter baumannii]KAB1605098.1 hypothetical protein F8B13_08770 [Acinetobacter baumannii]
MGSCAAPSAKGDDKFITTDYLQQCRKRHLNPYLMMLNCSRKCCLSRRKSLSGNWRKKINASPN